MRKRVVYAMVAAVLLSLTAVSCKTSEENYKAAYDIAARKQVGGVNRDVSSFIEREKRLSEQKVVAGDTVRMLTRRVRMIEGNDADIDNYCVVAGDFKQVFNAKSLSGRINTAEGNTLSYVVMNPEKLYYVVYRGFDTKEDAASFLKNKDNFKVKLPVEQPWILETQK